MAHLVCEYDCEVSGGYTFVKGKPVEVPDEAAVLIVVIPGFSHAAAPVTRVVEKPVPKK